MPRRRYKKRRGYRKRRRFTRTKELMPGFPATKLVKHRYCDVLSLVPGVGISAFAYAANGMYDPYIPAGGHQPLGYDEWSQFYNHYVVIGAKVTCQFVLSSSGQNTSMATGIYLADDSVIPTSLTELVEQGLGTYRIQASGVNAPGNYQRQTKTFSAKKFFNVTDIKDNIGRIGATNTANPAELAVFNIWAASVDGTSIGSIDCLMTIEYLALWSEPKSLTQST